jgi:hypothetical protein
VEVTDFDEEGRDCGDYGDGLIFVVGVADLVAAVAEVFPLLPLAVK